MSDYSEAIDYFVDPSRVFVNQNSCETIVVHGTGGDANQTAQQLGDYFRENGLRTSVHFGIDRAGVIAQYVRLNDGGGGNCCVEPGYDGFWQQYLNKYGNLNLCSISIEHENDAANSLPLTDAQKQASFKLIAYLSQKYGIAPDRIKSHASIAPQTRAHCPGNYPWDELWTFLQQGGNMSIDISTPGVSSFYAASGSVWWCTVLNHDFVVGGAILDFYRAFGGNGLCGLTYLGLPLSNEIGMPGGVYQRFERGVLCYDPNHTNDNPPGAGSVYLMHIEQGAGQDPRITPLQGQIAQLIAQQTSSDTTKLQEMLSKEQLLNQQMSDKLHQINQLSTFS